MILHLRKIVDGERMRLESEITVGLITVCYVPSPPGQSELNMSFAYDGCLERKR